MPTPPPVRSPRRLGCPAAVLLGAVALGACNEADDPVWKQFNAPGDEVVLQVGAATLLDAVSTTLHSSSGIVEVGAGRAEPGGGPIGTEYLFVVEVADEYENKVGRSTVRLESESHGSDEYEMDPDSADEGTWTLTLVSVGAEGEERQDTATFRLWYDVSDEEGSSDDTGG